jgi:SAM-dependent methyltransferase
MPSLTKKVKGVIKGAEPTVGTSNLSNREAWLEEALQRIPAGLTILDAGAGELQYKRFCSHLKYTSQDLGEYDGLGDETGLHTSAWDNSKLDIQSDIIDIPVEDHSFDAIMCTEVFEHIARPVEAVKEFSRIIKPGGYLLITTPVSSLTHFAPFYFYNGYTRYFFETILGDYDFDNILVEYNGNYFEFVAQEVRRIDHAGKVYASAKKPGFLARAATHLTLRRLEKMAAADTGSHELASHGLHVTARKKQAKK